MEIIDTRIIFPLISILAVGSLGVSIIKKRIFKLKTSETFLEHLLESLVVGTLLLIIPMVSLAILADRIDSSSILERFVYIYFAIGLAYLVIRLYFWVRRKLPSLILKERKKLTQSIETLLIITLCLMFFFYILQSLVYPLRGWDFLHFYLPNSFRIYITGQLGLINELNFFPQFKPPLNILLYAFAFFTTQTEMLHLVPMLYLAGTVYLCYKIAVNEGLSKKIALIGSIAFLATPFTFFLVYEFQYYQEVYVMFFATSSFYFFRKFLQTEKTREQFYLAILVSLSLSGCVLSKISGFVIPLVIFVAMPSDKIGKVIRMLVVAGFAFQLVRKSMFETYLGTGIFILLLAIYCLYLVYTSKTLTFSYKRWIFIVGIFLLPLLAGILWGLHILTIPGVREYLFDLYVNLRYNLVSLEWPGIALPGTITYLENAHTATFFSSSFSLLFASMFAGTWALFKIVGFIKSNNKYNEIILWLLIFYIFWQGFFSMGSIRYLSPIIVPITFVFLVGISSVISFFNKRDGKERDGFLALLFIIPSSFLSLYPVLPFETINEEFHLRWYLAHYRMGSVIGYILLFTLITLLLIWLEKRLKLSYSLIFTKKFNARKIIAGFLIFIICFVPFGAQFALLIDTRFNLSEFQSTYCYYTRETYLELIEAINRLGYTDDQAVLTINTPGLEYYASQPVIDMFMLSFIQNSGLENTTFPLGIENVTRTIDFFKQYNVAIFVTLTDTNVWYPAFMLYYYWSFFIYRLLFNNLLFTWRFSNEEFTMLTINEYDPYVGPVDIQLVGSNEKESLLALNPNSLEINNDTASIDALLDLTSVPTTGQINVSISSEYSTFSNDTSVYNYVEYQTEKPSNEAFTRISLLNMPLESVKLKFIHISISFENTDGFFEERQFDLIPLDGESVNITREDNSWIYTGHYGLIYS
ncbi:MAG: ArnT family glycosyltransferase [Candidatus Heimdallarchaeaceae archaeon]|jgi:hypothetical protein